MHFVFSRHALSCISVTICFSYSLGAQAQSMANPVSRPAGEQRPEDRNPSPLTAEQVAKVRAVLATYKPAALKAEDAKAIKRALRDAGLRHNAALDKAISDAGFSPQKLEELDPRPARPPGPPGAQGDGSPPPPPPRPADGAPRKP